MTQSKAKPETRDRAAIDQRYRWKLADIFDGWDAWQQSYGELEKMIERFATLQGTLAKGPEALLAALTLEDDLGQLSYKVWFYPSLMYDEDQRDNDINARRQKVSILFAKASQASAWFNPELLAVPLETVRAWMQQNDDLALYRFYIEDLYRQQEHVLDDKGERLMSYSARFNSAPGEAYGALTTADMKHPKVTLQDGSELTVTQGAYRATLATNRNQADRRVVFDALYGAYETNINTYAAIYDGIAQRDWFHAQARGYSSTLEAALHGNNIPTSVVENLIDATRAGTEPLRKYHRLRKKVLGLEQYHLFDGSVPLVNADKKYFYDDVLEMIVESVAPLGDDYQQKMRSAVGGGWIDVYENEGKRSGAYSAGVYGVHPYMLLNYNDTLDDVFTLAHELGHSLHTLLSHEAQPFRYASYTIFVAEVASTLNEALLLELMLSRTDAPAERAVLLQHAIDSIVGTFYSQVLFANWELEAHRLAERGEPINSDSLSALYMGILRDFYADDIDHLDKYKVTWARIPHFFRSPYYVYQYATCFASSAMLLSQLEQDREGTVGRYLELLRSGGSDFPMEQLRSAGVDLDKPEAVQATVDQLDRLVDRLSSEIDAIGS
ncbi:MAG: oligoendopeptidase F [Myxococcales bacterium]|nr:oligoendopeptidase F [Myxococcales bacterium]